MSIKRFFTDRLGRVRPITDNVQQQAAPQQEAQKQPVMYINVREEGFKDGVLNVPKVHFENWIDHSEKLEAVKHKLQTLRADLDRYTAKLYRSETDTEKLQVEIAGNTEKIKHQEQLAALQQEKKQQVKSQIMLLQEKLAALKPHYGSIVATLFLLAGLALLAADFAISDAIVGTAFNMDNGLEKYLFAAGMAVMAFAIKPAIDRVFEKKYADGSTSEKKRNHAFLIVVALMVLGTLTILGVFRSEADLIIQETSKLNQQNNYLRSDFSVDNSAQVQANADQIAALNKKLSESGTGKIAYVLLAVVFALAGALCLSLAFPALEIHAKKVGLRVNILWQERELTNQHQVLLSLLQIISNLKTAIAEAQTTLNCLPAAAPLQEKTEALKLAIQEQVEIYRQLNAECLTTDYNDAFEEALAYEVEGKPTIYWKDTPGIAEKENTPTQPAATPATDSTQEKNWLGNLFGSKAQNSEKQPAYVHQRLRKLIQERSLN